MTTGTFVVLMANLLFIGLLPIIFFRRDGRLNIMWWVLASPFFLSGAYVVGQYLGFTSPMYNRQVSAVIEAVATVLSVGSIALIAYTLGTHRRRLSLWHQKNDAPEEIVTYGAYRYVRHPFYSSFILALTATAILSLTPWALVTSIFGVMMLNYTAALEEKKLAGSEYGSQYQKYIEHSGRFMPKVRRGTA